VSFARVAARASAFAIPDIAEPSARRQTTTPDRRPSKGLDMSNPRDQKALSGCRILIVEDDSLLAFDIAEFLEDVGARSVGPFATMVEALDGMSKFDAVDGAILDIGLGDQTSYPLAEALQTTGIPFLFLSGTNRVSLPTRFERTSHVLKPHSEAELLRELLKLNMC
jgi:CheY-like chemotaxis protein